MSPVTSPDEDAPPPVTSVNEHGASRYVLLCEHASNHIPEAYRGLGLKTDDLARHIAWDIGAAELARLMSTLLDAPLFLSGYSRLLIDCNRPPGAPTSIPTLSEATRIPGNHHLEASERARREAAYFAPFQAEVARHLDRRAQLGRSATVLGIHSFTPMFLGIARPWHVGVLHSGATGFGRALIARLAKEPGPPVGDNEPYRIEPEHDYTVPVHGDARGLDAALIEVRQDLLQAPGGPPAWAQRLGAALADLAVPRASPQGGPGAAMLRS